MVLSNKKLKLKLRAELAKNKASEVSSSSNSLKTLLDAETSTPRLSKREKRRKLRPLQPSQPPEQANKETHTEGSNQKKRKRKVQDDDVADEATTNKSENNTKKKKKKKKHKNKKKKATTVEEKGSNGGGEVAETIELTKTNTSTSQKSSDDPTKVYVGGIPYYSTEDDIRSYFESCGTITEIDCMTFPETGKFRGIAIISFKTEAAAKRAMALDGSDMGGLFLTIQPYKATRFSKASDFAPEILEGYNRIYVGNLSWDITEEDLKKFFKNCNITSLRFGLDKETGEFRGYAHVDFSDSQSLKSALTLDQNVLYGRPVRISCAVPLKKKPGTHTSSVSTVNGVDGDKSSSLNGDKSSSLNGDKASSTTTGSGKMRRRTCYECGEKGHTFSACPKKQVVVETAT